MSFRARLTLAYLALLTLTLSGFGFGVYAYVDSRLHQEFVSNFRTQARQLDQFATGDQGYNNVFFLESTLEQGRGADQDLYYSVRAVHEPENQHYEDLDFKSPGLSDVALPAVPADGKVHVLTRSENQLNTTLAVYRVEIDATSDPEAIRARRLPNDDPARHAWKGRMILARDLGSVESSLGLLRKILIAGGTAVLAVAALVGWVLAAGLLRPLARMKSTAQGIGDDRDFTRRMPVENDRDELGRLSTSFNQMLTELERSHVDLQTALESQRRFVADASHELRTPMTAIRTNVEFLARVPGAHEEDRAGALHDVLAEMRRMETLVGDLLALARLEATGARAARRAVRLDHLLADIYRDASRLAPAGIEVRLAPTPEVWVSGDRDDLRRAVWNLVENALKYTRAGRVDLRLRAADGLAELEVADTGIGIAAADQARVFDRFWRAQSTRGTSGSGLGLAITKWVAQAHGGTVLVESVLGQGTTFALQLPATARPGRSQRARAAGAAEPDELVRAGGPGDSAHS
jgi:signal transduction histidine kinase